MIPQGLNSFLYNIFLIGIKDYGKSLNPSYASPSVHFMVKSLNQIQYYYPCKLAIKFSCTVTKYFQQCSNRFPCANGPFQMLIQADRCNMDK